MPLLLIHVLSPPPAARAQDASPQAQVTAFIKSTLDHPGSYEGVQWSKPVKLKDGPYAQAVRHLYRLRDPMYGWVSFDDIFYLDAEGRVMGSTNTTLWKGPRWGAGKEKW